MRSVRAPAVAGLFYPADRRQLHALLQGFLGEAKTAGTPPKALIAPHAGYVYSGPVAASAYVLLKPLRHSIRRVVLLGPSHRIAFRGLALSSTQSFATPLGEIPLDLEAQSVLAALPFVHVLDQAHVLEHSLEVQLPFLQEMLEDFKLVPIVVGDAVPGQVAEAIDLVWGGDETLIVVSSDLSHYHDYATARRMDRATSDAIESLHPEEIGFEDACGRLPVAGLLIAARRRGLSAKTVDLRNSGDTAGSKDSVVGYGAYVIEPGPLPA
ncbi:MULTISPECIES: AmmeMemoRadiSam system protein B [Methylococcus]|jgi:AmmeMemoRadiSam system protein B|uniref:MEMO1 family protein MCNOR_1311 n=1 Tax=Methylococcus capsulatus TaxID=414 RepID=A0AA35Y0B4_METCP|nr:AmmeMemoRadiSam system protein B [Methylococcus capsulatus]CAI8786869.1 MEMO1 family protein MCNOR_v1_1311 [Methylococcus capsulatus]